jgi:hypothetical protein
MVNSSFPFPPGLSNQKTKTKKKRSKVEQTKRKTRETKNGMILADEVVTHKRHSSRVIITIIGIAVAVAISVVAYYWIKSYLLKAIAVFISLKALIVTPFTWAKNLWISITDLRWMVAPFAWIWACVEEGFWWILRLGEKVKNSIPRVMESEVWKMEWLRRPEWLSWGLNVPEAVKDGFEAFVPDGIQMVEDVLEEL